MERRAFDLKFRLTNQAGSCLSACTQHRMTQNRQRRDLSLLLVVVGLLISWLVDSLLEEAARPHPVLVITVHGWGLTMNLVSR